MMPLTSTSANYSTDFNFNYGGYHVGDPTRESRLSSSAPLSPTSPVASMTNRYDELSLSKHHILMHTMNYPGMPSTPAANNHNLLTSIEEDTKLSASSSPNDNGLRVMVSCNNCKRAKTKCDHGRPCTRCIRTGRSSTCVDAVHKKRGRKRSWVNKGGDGDSSSSVTTEHASPPKLSNKLIQRQQHQRATTEPTTVKSSPSSTPASPFHVPRERAYTYSGPDPTPMVPQMQPLQSSPMQPILQPSYGVAAVPQNLQSYQYHNVSLDWSTTVPVHPEYVRDRAYSDTQPWSFNNTVNNHNNHQQYFHVSASVPVKERSLTENHYYHAQPQSFSVPLKDRSISNINYIPQYHQKGTVMNSYVQPPNDNDNRSTLVESVQFQKETPLPILPVDEEESFAFKRARRGSTTLKNLRLNIQRHQPQQQQQQQMDLGAPSTPSTAPPFLFEPYDFTKFNHANDGYIPPYSQHNGLNVQPQQSFPRPNNQNASFGMELNAIPEDRYLKPESTSMSTENTDSNSNRLLDLAWSQFSAEAPILGRRNSRRLSIFAGEFFAPNGSNSYLDASYAPCVSRQTSRRLSVFAGDLLGPSSSFDYPIFPNNLDSSELSYPIESLHPRSHF